MLAIVLILICLLSYFIVRIATKAEEPAKEKIYIEKVVEVERKESTKHTQSKRKKHIYRKTQKMRWRDKMLDISMIPKTVELDRETLLPQSLTKEYGYGRRFNTFVLEEDKSRFHRSTCGSIKRKKKKLVHRYAAICNAVPCDECTPVDSIDDWYVEFMQKNFGKFTSYEDFKANIGLPDLKLPKYKKVAIGGNKVEQLSMFDEKYKN